MSNDFSAERNECNQDQQMIFKNEWQHEEKKTNKTFLFKSLRKVLE